MKRFALLLAILMMVILPMSAAAAGTLEWEGNSDNDTVIIRGTASPETMVTIIILNDGYSYDDYISDSAAVRNAAIKYFGYTMANAEGAFGSPSIKFVTGGEFDVYAAGQTIENYRLYTSADKRAAIIRLKDEKTNSAAENLIEKFELGDNTLYTEYPDSISNLISRSDMLNGADSANLNNEREKILNILLIAPFDNNREDLVFADGGYELIRAEEIGVVSSGEKIPEYESFLSDGTADEVGFSLLNDTGKANVKKALMSAEYNSAEDILETFKESYYYNVIMNNKYEGTGHIQKLFEDSHFGAYYETAFAAEFEEAGKSFPPTKNISLYERLLNSGASNLSEIAEELVKTSTGTGGKVEGLNPPQSFRPSSPSGNTGGTSAPGTNPPTETKAEFNDISDHWANEAIKALAEKGIINGYDDGSFRPDNSVTRAEFAKMLVSLLGLDISSKEAGFADVNSSEWYAPYIAAAAKAGLIQGSDGRFNPNDIISRQDTAVILARALNLKASGESSFTDGAQIADYAKDAVSAVREAELMQGMEDGSFEPLGSLTRAQAAAVLYRILQRGV